MKRAPQRTTVYLFCKIHMNTGSASGDVLPNKHPDKLVSSEMMFYEIHRKLWQMEEVKQLDEFEYIGFFDMLRYEHKEKWIC